MLEKYECDQCGACCQGHLIVEADWVDLAREPRLLEADRHRTGWPIEKVLEDLEEPGKAMLLALGRRCPFLDGENRCEIYPTRPAVCVAMEAGDEQCQQCRREAGLPPLEPVAQARDPCECEQPGHFYSGVPGILANIEDGKLAADAKVERCDVCSRYPSDDAARKRLSELGLTAKSDAAKQSYTVHCFVSVRVGFRDVIASNHRQAAGNILQQFDWKSDIQAAVFDDGLTELLVDVDGDPEHRQSKRFDAGLAEITKSQDQPVVWLLAIRSELGQHTTVCCSYESAKQTLFGYVKEQWESEFDDEPLPDHAEPAIRRYFDRSAESYDIRDVNVV